MLLPSDVARLVLGYLQEEGLSATSQAFIHESPNLKEYADHTTADGTIPACVFSLFGKGLTTILNEYVATKTKESSHEVPVVMTSLWKKLDFTLNQIKSMQNSPSISANQRIRSRVGMANMARQRALTLTPSCGVVSSSLAETGAILSPAHTSLSALGHLTPVCYSGQIPRAAPATFTTPRNSGVQIVVSEQRLIPGPMSPGRRKWDTPRKRSGAPTGSSGPGRSAAATSGVSTEPQPEEVVDENFPQLMIQNARDKILKDRSLQEKLAENINKILANEPAPQTSKTSVSTVEADQSIDDFLGLQDEIHMSDDAIHDILEQTESDPAFQALFELFDCNKNKFPDGDGDGDVSTCPEECDTAGPSSAAKPIESEDPGATLADTDASENTQKMKGGQERKNRKSTAPTLVKKILISSNARSSRLENSSARVIVNPVDVPDVSSAAVETNNKQKALPLNRSASETQMDVDEPLHTPPLPCNSLTIPETSTNFSTPTTTALVESATSASSRVSPGFPPPIETPASNMGHKQDHIQAQRTAAFSSALSSQHLFLSPAQLRLNNTPVQTASFPLSASTSEASTGITASSNAIAAFRSPMFASTSATLPATSTLPTPAAAPFSCPLVAAPSADPSSSSTAAAADSNIMSLKIIISENQEEGAAADTALNNAISSISGDKMPTIYISSPAKPSVCPSTPKGSLDEAAQAVNGLQNSEVHASPVTNKAGAFIASPLTGTSQGQQNYIIQLPLDPTNSALRGATTTSYILMTESPATNCQTTQVLLPAGVSKGQPNQFGLTSSHTQGFPHRSALILPSPVKPMMLPVSVVGQNTLGNVQMVSNQLVAIQNPLAVQQQTETVKAKPATVTTKQSATPGGEKNPVSKVGQPSTAETTNQQDAAKGPKHRRILCFHQTALAMPQQATATTTTTTTTTSAAPNATTSQSPEQPEKDNKQPAPRTKPAILGGNRPKRRVETVRCSVEPGGDSMKESNLLQHQQKDPVKKTSRKQEHIIQQQESQSVDASQPETRKKSESGKRSKSTDRKHNRDTTDHKTKSKQGESSRSSSSDSALRSGSMKDKGESSGKETPEKSPLKSREGRPEKRVPSQATPNVTANKENEMKGSKKDQKQPTPSSSPASRDFSPPVGTQPTAKTQSKGTKTPSKTSSLAKQAAEMLQDIQGVKAPSTPSKKLADPSQEAAADRSGTPSRQKKVKDAEGTPKHLLLPNNPDVPTCSPASEAGSESSINMAAHTLMILSRAAIARTGTPLKDSLRQEGAGEKSPASTKNSKKRKQTSPEASPPAKKESKQSPSKKKDREKKKLIDCFPHDLDVDKFLSSLHYDE